MALDLSALHRESHVAWLALQAAIEHYALVELQIAGSVVRNAAPSAHSLVVHTPEGARSHYRSRPLILRDAAGQVLWFDPEVTGHPDLSATSLMDVDVKALQNAARRAAGAADLYSHRLHIGDLAVDSHSERYGWESPFSKNLLKLDVDMAIRGIPPAPVFALDESFLESWLGRMEGGDAGPGEYYSWNSLQLGLCEQPLTAASIAEILQLANDQHDDSGLETSFRVQDNWATVTPAGHLLVGVELPAGRRISIGPLTDEDLHALSEGRTEVQAVVLVIKAIAGMLNDAAAQDALLSMVGVADTVHNAAQLARWVAATRDPSSTVEDRATPPAEPPASQPGAQPS
ncbi:hypothetical protein [Actinoplanes awajinensis]|uniref:Uncharacterized protein n=1 Tax=Actinoplanes awajinensis subsp. mycoplanecinus TaxID=135947 RepID=A0A0X3V4C1_9ACTN|nr:hypothetical protein [Actinoplanes awajinensis]KUL39297.1 hypothetical protein ADL15_10045 [Actinoplanes awajinensis subsp. mycoplanecinus]